MENIVKKETEMFGGGTSEYEYNISALRILACIMVIGIHVSASYVVNFSNISNFEFAIGNLWNSFSRPAVPIFVMISGRYALAEENENYKKYYLKILKRVYIPTVIWSGVYMFMRYYYQKVPIKGIINATLGGIPYYHLWYLYMMIGIYLLVPNLIKLKNKIGEKNFLKLGIVLVFISFFIALFRDFSSLKNIGILKYYWKFNQFKFINYIGYFMLGYSLKNLRVDLKKVILITLISGTSLFLATQFFQTSWEVIYDNNYPGVVLYSIFLYLTFQQLNIKKYKFLDLAKYTFGIYLVHPLVLLLDIKNITKLSVMIKISLRIGVVFVSSLIITMILNSIKTKLK